MKKLLTVLYTWCLLLLLGCGVLLLVTAPKEATVSESENRMLEAFPSADAQSLLSGAFSSGFERYLSDRFFDRDGCIALSGMIKNSLSLLSDADALKLAAMDLHLDEAPEADTLPVESAVSDDEVPLQPSAETPSPKPAETPAPRPAETPAAQTAAPSDPTSSLIRVPMALPSQMPRTPHRRKPERRSGPMKNRHRIPPRLPKTGPIRRPRRTRISPRCWIPSG